MAKEQKSTVPEDFDDMFAGICAIYCAESDAQARAEAEEHVHHHFTKALAAFDSNTMSLIPGHMTPRGMRTWLAATSGKEGQSLVFGFEEALQNGTLIVGSPQTCVELIRRQRSEGKRGTLLAMFQFGSLPHALTMKNLALFGREVLPAIRDV
jgi:alkanesulfonate monooxygenase SsuD/methylene tetrahydromethanopterin reductase-like flavin-dependent oxidoreductase (luciferase family)